MGLYKMDFVWTFNSNVDAVQLKKTGEIIVFYSQLKKTHTFDHILILRMKICLILYQLSKLTLNNKY